MLGNVVVGALSVNNLAVIECMYCVHDNRVDLSSCPCFSTVTTVVSLEQASRAAGERAGAITHCFSYLYHPHAAGGGGRSFAAATAFATFPPSSPNK